MVIRAFCVHACSNSSLSNLLYHHDYGLLSQIQNTIAAVQEQQNPGGHTTTSPPAPAPSGGGARPSAIDCLQLKIPPERWPRTHPPASFPTLTLAHTAICKEYRLWDPHSSPPRPPPRHPWRPPRRSIRGRSSPPCWAPRRSATGNKWAAGRLEGSFVNGKAEDECTGGLVMVNRGIVHAGWRDCNESYRKSLQGPEKTSAVSLVTILFLRWLE